MKLNIRVPKIRKLQIPKIIKNKQVLILIYTLSFLAIASLFVFLYKKSAVLNLRIKQVQKQNEELQSKYEESQKNLTDLQNEDQVVKNRQLEDEITNIRNSYKKSVSVYELLLDLKNISQDTTKLDASMAMSLSLLSQRDYQKANETLTQLEKDINTESNKIAASYKIPENVTTSSTPPSSGYARQQVQTDVGTFLVDIVSADLSSTKAIVDTASDSNCSNDCPVLPLAEYVSRTGAYAGVNGTYFCPATYPTCAGKTNSYDLLVMNYKKTYFNSDNNVYSSNPGVIFADSYIRFVSAISQWGRDTSPNGVLSNYPLLVFNSNITFGGNDDPKMGSKGNRSFVANHGNTIYIGVVHNVTVAESAHVMKELEMENAMNLDDGGSTALWSGGYKVGPGRNLPNVILFVKK